MKKKIIPVQVEKSITSAEESSPDLTEEEIQYLCYESSSFKNLIFVDVDMGLFGDTLTRDKPIVGTSGLATCFGILAYCSYQDEDKVVNFIALSHFDSVEYEIPDSDDEIGLSTEKGTRDKERDEIKTLEILSEFRTRLLKHLSSRKKVPNDVKIASIFVIGTVATKISRQFISGIEALKERMKIAKGNTSLVNV